MRPTLLFYVTFILTSFNIDAQTIAWQTFGNANGLFTISPDNTTITLNGTSSNLTIVSDKYIPANKDGSIKVVYTQSTSANTAKPITKIGFGLGIKEDCRIHSFKNSYLIMIDDNHQIKAFKPLVSGSIGVNSFASKYDLNTFFDNAGSNFEIKRVGNEIQFFYNGAALISNEGTVVKAIDDATIGTKEIIPIVVFYTDDLQNGFPSPPAITNYWTTISQTININATVTSTGPTITTPSTIYGNQCSPTVVYNVQCDEAFNLKIDDGAVNSVEINPNSVIGTETEILPLTLSSKQLAANQDGGIEFDVSAYQSTGSFTLGLKSVSALYAFNFNNNIVTVSNNGISVPLLPGAQISSPSGKFSINKIGSNLDFYYNLIKVGTIAIPANTDLTLDFAPVGSIKANISLCFKRPTIVDATDEETFIVLKKELDASYTKLTDDKIRIAYKEDYNSDNDDVNVKIFDKKRNILLDQKIANSKVGTNYKQINIANISLKNSEAYLLELTANKGEKYYTRFIANGATLPTPVTIVPPIIDKSTIADVVITCPNQMPTSNPTVTDGYTGAAITLSYREEKMTKTGCVNCFEKVLRIWEGQDSKCYPVKVIQAVTIKTDILPTFTSTPPQPQTTNCGTIASFTIPSATGPCGSIIPKEEQVVSYESVGKIITYKWTITDDCGNTAVQTSTITFTDANCPTINTTQGLPLDRVIQDPLVECNKYDLSATTYTCNSPIGVIQEVEANDPRIQLIAGCLKDDFPPLATDDCDNSLDMTIKYSIICDIGGYYVLKRWIFTDDAQKSVFYTQIIKVFGPKTALTPAPQPLLNGATYKFVRVGSELGSEPCNNPVSSGN